MRSNPHYLFTRRRPLGAPASSRHSSLAFYGRGRKRVCHCGRGDGRKTTAQPAEDRPLTQDTTRCPATTAMPRLLVELRGWPNRRGCAASGTRRGGRSRRCWGSGTAASRSWRCGTGCRSGSRCWRARPATGCSVRCRPRGRTAIGARGRGRARRRPGWPWGAAGDGRPARGAGPAPPPAAAGAGLLPGQRRAAGGRDVGVAAARGGVGGVGVAALGGGGGSPRDDERRGGGRGRVLDAHLHGDGARRAVAGLGLRLRGARRLPRLGLRPTTATLTGVRPAGLCWRGGARWSRAMLWRGYRHARGGPVFHPGRAETRGAWPETEDWLHQMDALLGATETMDAA